MLFRSVFRSFKADVKTLTEKNMIDAVKARRLMKMIARAETTEAILVRAFSGGYSQRALAAMMLLFRATPTWRATPARKIKTLLRTVFPFMKTWRRLLSGSHTIARAQRRSEASDDLGD